MVKEQLSEIKPSLQDFSLVKTYVDKTKDEYQLQNTSFAFYYFALNWMLDLQDNEIDDSITDTAYLQIKGSMSGHDRGIDALYIDSNETPQVIHLFNFKYTDEFKNTAKNFPAKEIDKIVTFLSALMHKDETFKEDINPVLFSKVEEIWSIFQSENPRFVIHICSNYYKGIEESESKRFEKEIDKYSNFTIEYHQMPYFVARLTRRGKQTVHGKIRAIDKNLFEKSDGDIRALIVDIDARDLIRIVLDDEDIRNAVDLDDYGNLAKFKILEDAFEDNVRIYLKLRSRINRNIKETALSDENHRFFYFNNGITLTCDKFKYPKNQRSPIIELENLQIVNGGQTVHALYEAFLDNPSKFEDIEVLCRIYQTDNRELSVNIAEFTNSQNPVKSRDIRSNDYAQKKLEAELLAKGFYYERKKAQHQGKPKQLRIDAEKTGQALMALFYRLPAEAKDQKRLIFADKYEDVFVDNITADDVLLAVRLFDKIENEKNKAKPNVYQDPATYESASFILHSSYYLLYLIGELATIQKIPITYTNIDLLFSLYPSAVDLISKAVFLEQTTLRDYKESYNHRMFFKGNRPKKHLEELLKQPTSK